MLKEIVMDIREYNVKSLPYHFVLFYNLPEDKLLIFRNMYQGQPEDNALLTYCYLDEMAGLSYRAICWATVAKDSSITYHHDRKMTTMLILLEGGLNCDAYVFEEKDMPYYKDIADEIKGNYGNMMDQTKIDDDDPFSEFRHPSYPRDILAVFLSSDEKVEKMWVTEMMRNEDGSIQAKLINEPYNLLLGLHEGDFVTIVPYKNDDGGDYSNSTVGLDAGIRGN